MDLVHLDDELTYRTRACKARLAVYIGDLGDDSAARARQILARVPTPNQAVLLAVDPNRHVIEVVYGAGVRGRGIQTRTARRRGCRIGVQIQRRLDARPDPGCARAGNAKTIGHAQPGHVDGEGVDS